MTQEMYGATGRLGNIVKRVNGRDGDGGRCLLDFILNIIILLRAEKRAFALKSQRIMHCALRILYNL